jgi:hypothetical protein
MRRVIFFVFVATICCASESFAQYWIPQPQGGTADCFKVVRTTPAEGPKDATCWVVAVAWRLFLPPHKNYFVILAQSSFTPTMVCPAGSDGGVQTDHTAIAARSSDPIRLFGSALIIANNNHPILSEQRAIDYNGNKTGNTFFPFDPSRCWLP